MKQTIKKPVYHHLNWSYGISIEDMRKDLDILEKLGVTGIDIQADSYVQYEPYIEREETNEEYEARLKAEKEYAERQRFHDLAILANLKAKYEDPLLGLGSSNEQKEKM